MFGYSIDKNDQDWTYTKSEFDRIDDYLEAYGKLEKKETKFSLLEMIIQAVNDQPTELLDSYWNKLKPILEADFELNKYTIHYWCSWETDELHNCFEISEKMREYWLDKIKVTGL